MSNKTFNRRDVLSTSAIGIGSTIFGINIVEASDELKQERESEECYFLDLEVKSTNTPSDALISVGCGADLPPVTYHKKNVYITYPGKFRFSNQNNVIATWNGTRELIGSVEEDMDELVTIGKIGTDKRIVGSRSTKVLVGKENNSFRVSYGNESVLVDPSKEQTITTQIKSKYQKRNGEMDEANIILELTAKNKGNMTIHRHPEKIMLPNNEMFIEYVESISSIRERNNRMNVEDIEDIPGSVRKPMEIQMDPSADAYLLADEQIGTAERIIGE